MGYGPADPPNWAPHYLASVAAPFHLRQRVTETATSAIKSLGPQAPLTAVGWEDTLPV